MEPAQEIPFNTTPDYQPTPIPVGVGPVPYTPVLSPELMSLRADKASYGTGEDPNKMLEDFSRGNEPAIREETSAKYRQQHAEEFNRALYDWSYKKGSPLTTQDIDSMQTSLIKNRQFEKPSSVFEELTTQKAMDVFYQTAYNTPDSWWQSYLEKNPKQEQQVTALTQNYSKIYSFLQKELQDTDGLIDADSYSNWIVRRGIGFIPGLGTAYKEYLSRGYGTPFSQGILAGTNREEQRLNLMRRQFPDAQSVVEQAKDYMVGKQGDPYAYKDWLLSMLGAIDPTTTNVISGLNIALGIVPSVGGVAVKASERASAAWAEKAMSDLAHSIVSNQKPNVAVPAAVGNVTEAATQKVLNTVVAAKQGESPIQPLLDRLATIHNIQQEDLANVPNHYRELYTRALEQNSPEEIIKLLENTIRGDRIGSLAQDEGVIRQLVDATVDFYKGSGNRLLDVRNDPLVHEPITNTHWTEMKLGSEGGKLFTRPEHAVEESRRLGITLKGSDDMPRQLEIQKNLARITEELAYHRVVANPSEETKAMLGLTAANRTPEFEKNITKLEKEYVDNVKELSVLRMSPGAAIENNGHGFYISKWVPLKEDTNVMHDLLWATKAASPESINRIYIDVLRTHGETFSKDLDTIAKVSSYAPNNFFDYFKKQMEDIAKLARWNLPGTEKKQRWRDFEKLINETPNIPHPVTGKPGYRFETIGEIEDWYQRSVGRNPIDAEIKAFFQYKKFVEADKMLRMVRQYTNEARAGTQMHRFSMIDANGKRFYSDWFPGIAHKEFPKGTDESVLLTKGEFGKEKATSITNWATVSKDIEEGRKQVIEVLYPGSRPLQNFGKNIKDARVRYVVSDKVETKPNVFRDIPDLATEYEHRFSIGQAKIVKDYSTGHQNYERDNIAFHVNNAAEGNKFVKLLNQIQDHMVKGEEQAARDLARGLPMDWATFRKWYTDHGFRDDSPYMVIPRGKSTVQLDNTLKDKFGSDFRDKSYDRFDMGRQDPYKVFEVRDVGTKYNPAWSSVESPTINPITTLSRGMNKIIKTNFWDDYKITSVNSWIKEAKDYLKLRQGHSVDNIVENPYYYFFNGEFLPGTPKDIYARLAGNRFKIKQVIGTPSETDSFLHSIAQKMHDSVYEKLGPTASRFISPPWLLNKVSDWETGARSIAFHALIGSWNPVQWVVNNMNYLTIIGAGGRKALPGIFGGMMHGNIYNEKWIPGMDKTMSNLGLFRPGEFTEAVDGLNKTGFYVVGREHLFSPASQANIIQTGKQSMLDAGTYFWKSAERNQRSSAWFTAYKEFRDTRPTGPISNYEWGRILRRANDLSGDMTEAAKSMVQTGPFKYATQFFGYNMRLAELMTGKRLTGTEKARMLTTYATVLGVPAAYNLGVYPFGDVLRQSAIDKGYTPGQNWIETVISEGVLGGIIDAVSGHTGQQAYNVGARYGSVGQDLLRSLWENDKKTWEILGGASYNLLSQTWENTDSLRRSMGAFLRGDKDSPVKASDFLDPTKTISTVHYGTRLWEALSTGNWLNKRGQLLEKDVSALDALWMTGSGTQHYGSADLRIKTQIEHNRQEEWKKAENEFRKNIAHYHQAMRDNDPAQAIDYNHKAFKALIQSDYPMENLPVLMGSSTAEPLAEKAERALRTRKVPQSRKEEQLKVFTNENRLGK